ncbi:LuxR C-terminal-related transcriptional regulator [Rhodococcoides yunnanense]|uniref:LuxR C-terminal-related transcriptional regulator n=1 Tax=Rhodococcoides yunnanense TaxID=278209 RepID=UPI000A003E0D
MLTSPRTHVHRSSVGNRVVPSGRATGLRPPASPARIPAPTYARAGLSEREVTVLKAWLDCDSKLDVAAHLHIALGTVNTHLSRIRDKYAKVDRPAPTKAALVARALQDGFVTLDEL